MRREFLKRVLTVALLSIAGSFPQLTCAADNDAARSVDDDLARSVLEKSDQIRTPQEGFQVEVTINTTAPDETPEVRKYRILSKGNENTLIQVIEPAIDRGQILLMRGRDLWVFMPSVSQPIRLSLSHRLTGQVANGDLARSNFTGDYTPKMLRTDTIGDEPYYVLELTAVDRSVTYHKVIYWVKQSNSWPHRAEFYSLSNRLLKTARYENFQSTLGKPRPTRLVMEDALRKGEESVLKYSGFKRRELPDKVFTKEYLQRLQ
jgi:outer membrane lipoprotein-sorting protein